MSKVNYRELCKILKFDHTKISHLHNPDSVLENETHKIPWDFKIQMDHLILARRPDLVIINKKITCRIVNFRVPADHRVKLKESEKENKYIDLARELKKTVEHKSNGYTNCRWCSWFSHQRVGARIGGLGNKRTNGGHLDHIIIEIGQNTEKSLGNLRRIVDHQTLVRSNRLTRV